MHLKYRWYNRKVKPRCFALGEAVGIYHPRKFGGRMPKWQNFFKTEGYILAKFNDATYLVESQAWKAPKIVHADKINCHFVNCVMVCCIGIVTAPMSKAG